MLTLHASVASAGKQDSFLYLLASIPIVTKATPYSQWTVLSEYTKERYQSSVQYESGGS